MVYKGGQIFSLSLFHWNSTESLQWENALHQLLPRRSEKSSTLLWASMSIRRLLHQVLMPDLMTTQTMIPLPKTPCPSVPHPHLHQRRSRLEIQEMLTSTHLKPDASWSLQMKKRRKRKTGETSNEAENAEKTSTASATTSAATATFTASAGHKKEGEKVMKTNSPTTIPQMLSRLMRRKMICLSTLESIGISRWDLMAPMVVLLWQIQSVVKSYTRISTCHWVGWRKSSTSCTSSQRWTSWEEKRRSTTFCTLDADFTSAWSLVSIV